MIGINKKNWPLYAVLVLYLAISVIMSFTPFSKIYIDVLNPLILIAIALFFYFFTRDYHNRNHNKYGKMQNVIIVIIAYCLIYYLSGLVFGFAKNSYSLSWKGIISNFYSFFTIAVLEEYLRHKLAISNKKASLFLITSLFVLLNIDFKYLFGITAWSDLILYVFSNIVPLIILNITLTYLAIRVNFTSHLLYRLVITAIMLFSPIIPNHEWIITNLLYLLVLAFVVSSVDYLVIREDKRTRKRELRSEKSVWALYLFTALFILFMIGVFKYQPIAIMSDSMYDYFARGDAVIIEKLDSDEIHKLEVGDVIYYHHENTYITHRIIDVEDDGSTYIFHTKGDNNELMDDWEVYEEDIAGIIRVRLKYLGWPSVWLYELMK